MVAPPSDLAAGHLAFQTKPEAICALLFPIEDEISTFDLMREHEKMPVFLTAAIGFAWLLFSARICAHRQRQWNGQACAQSWALCYPI
jgi:hypothetical protein